MEIKEQIEKAVGAITSDPKKIEAFKKDPASAVKAILGDKIPADVIDKVISGVKAKLTTDKLSGAAGALGGLFKK